MSSTSPKNVFATLTAFNEPAAAIEQGASLHDPVLMSDTVIDGQRARLMSNEANLTISDETMSSLEKLEVFHHEFKATTKLPQETVKTYEEGLAEGRAVMTAELESSRQQIAQIMDQIGTQITDIATQIEQSHARAIADMMRAVLPNLCDQMAGAEIMAFIKTLSAQAMTGKVSLCVHPDQVEAVQTMIETIGSGERGSALDFEINEQTDQTNGQVLAHWDGGKAEYDLDATMTSILNILGDLSPSNERGNTQRQGSNPDAAQSPLSQKEA